MKLSTVAIVGRPNVGKSTLFNRLLGRRKAIVYDKPGVTRDRQYGEGEWAGFVYRLVDTGGYEPAPSSDLVEQMRLQVELAVREADLILLVLDAREGLTPQDRDVFEKLRRVNKPLFLVVNKIDHFNQDPYLAEFYELGLGEVFPVSAEHGRQTGDLLDAIVRTLSIVSEKQMLSRTDEKASVRVTILGRPNVGKSTLLNYLYGSPRAVVHSKPGTTRDPVQILLHNMGGVFYVIDTAGVRKKSHAEDRIERVSIVKTFQEVDESEVVLLIVDVIQGFTIQDAKLAEEVLIRGKALVVLFNKWDQTSSDVLWAEVQKKVRKRYSFLDSIPFLKISAKTGLGASRIFPTVGEVHQEYSKRLSTSKLNEVFRQAVDNHPPATVSGKSLNLFYITQVSTKPPRFIVFANRPQKVPQAYRRYLIRCLRAEFSFWGTPIFLVFKSRKKKLFVA